MKEDCIFCRIAGKAADATVVYEDSQTLAFLDIHPLNPGHTLVIPKKHFTNMLEMPAEQAGRVFVNNPRLTLRGPRLRTTPRMADASVGTVARSRIAPCSSRSVATAVA